MDNLLKSRGLSVTQFRKEVLGSLTSRKHASSLAEIESDLTKFDRVTLYRTLKAFTEKGLIHEIAIPGKESVFALCQEECSDHHGHQHQHIHFSCTRCGEISCVETHQVPEIKLPGYHISGLEIQASGICPACSK
jgi:Fur family ferric uptake transcriptional regulator